MGEPTPRKIFLGIRPTSEKRAGNLMDIWELKCDGKYYCQSKDFSLTWNEIISDVLNGHLIELKEDKPKKNMDIY